jgi:hypothetical protein
MPTFYSQFNSLIILFNNFCFDPKLMNIELIRCSFGRLKRQSLQVIYGMDVESSRSNLTTVRLLAARVGASFSSTVGTVVWVALIWVIIQIWRTALTLIAGLMSGASRLVRRIALVCAISWALVAIHLRDKFGKRKKKKEKNY